MYGNVRDRSRQSNTWAINRIKDYLNKAQGVLWRQAKEWKCLEKQSTSSLVVGQENYALPSDFERPIHIQVESGSNYYEVHETNYDTIIACLNANTGGNARPSLYCIHYDQIYFDTTSDDTYTVRIDYIHQPSDMSDDEDTTVFPEHILEEYAYAFLMRDLGHDNKFSTAYQNFKMMTEEFAESDGRGEALHGFYDGLDGVAPYWSESYMWGGRTRRWHQG